MKFGKIGIFDIADLLMHLFSRSHFYKCSLETLMTHILQEKLNYIQLTIFKSTTLSLYFIEPQINRKEKLKN